MQAYGKAWHVRRSMEPEDAKEELAERVKHLDEEVPPETDIGRKIRKKKANAISRSKKVPRASQESGC